MSVSYKANGSAVPVTLVSNATYYPFGPLRMLTFGNGRTLTKTYDQNYGISSVASSASNGLILGLGLDVMGNVTTAKASLTAVTPDRNIMYDPLYRISNVQAGNGTSLEAYTYNGIGDRLSASLNAQPATIYSYFDNTHILRLNDTVRGYDSNGNLLGDRPVISYPNSYPANSWTFDDRNRMVADHIVIAPPHASFTGITADATYGYNGKGERVTKTVASNGGPPPQNAVFNYAQSGELLGEYTPTGAPITEYFYLGAMPIAAFQPVWGILYVETDQLGTPRVVVSPGVTTTKDKVEWKWDYFSNNSSFGQNIPSVQSITFNLRYPGQYFDAETGLHYNYFRDYEPGTGRYVESDPIGLNGDINTYAYVGGDPIGLMDLWGLCPKCRDPANPDHVVLLMQQPLSGLDWLTHNAGATEAYYQVQDKDSKPILGQHWLQEHLSRSATNSNTTDWVPMWANVPTRSDIHDFYSPAEAKRNGVANSSIFVDQWFSVKDAAGCVTDLSTVMRTTTTFDDGIQVNMDTKMIKP